MPTNYSSWSLDKLNKEIQKIQKVIAFKESRDRKATLAKLATVARKSGFELHELIGIDVDGTPAKSSRAKLPSKPASKSVAKSRKRGKVAPKYRNPANVKETWTGRGRQPVWVRKHLEGGGSLESVTIESREAVPS